MSQLSLAVGLGLGISVGALAAPTCTVPKVLVAKHQWQREDGLIDPAPVFKAHETDAAAGYWISSNERGEEGAPSKAGITIFEVGTKKVLAQLNIDNGCFPVIGLDGSVISQFGGCAPKGAERHGRHAHRVDTDKASSGNHPLDRNRDTWVSSNERSMT